MIDDDEVLGVFDAALPVESPQPDEHLQVIDGRYQIVSRIGEGGMGQVLHVRHRWLGKSFALKLMQADFCAQPEAVEIFQREARLASCLSHPNIVSIVDFGNDPDWGLFIVMELLDGEMLSERLQLAGSLPIPVVCDVAAQLLAALRHIHAHDVVHGDLKTDNVLCAEPSPGDRRRWIVKLLDFGMAQLASTTAGRRDTRIAGTPEYLAPERIRGEPPTPALDLYAFGVILYEMVTGSVPFSGDDPAAIFQQHFDAVPPPMESRRGEAVDPQLQSIVDRALAKQTSDRYSSASEVVADLDRLMANIGLRHRVSRRAGTEPGQSRADAAAAAFEAVSLPAVGLRADATIVITNRAFRRLLRCDDPGELEGTSAIDTHLGRLHIGLRDDLRLVAMEGKMVRRRLLIKQTGGGEAMMRMVMTPASGCGDCMLVLHALPHNKPAAAS